MTVKEKLDVELAAFEELLRKRELWSSYLVNFCRSDKISNSEGIYNLWKEWALQTPPYKWVASAFIWRETLENK